MTEIHGRIGLCLPVTLSNEKAPSPIRACSHPHSPGSGGLGPLTADARPISDPRSQPAWPASHYVDPTTGSVRSR
jgi:hypothetical protein